ncbi:MAG TPA: barstar family protein [Pseudonocardia sp.]|nr:barstar family protein [Pseudonocardia sp.]
MTRRPLFDPTDLETFRDRTGRYDWHLLRSSPVHRVDTSDELRVAADRLAGLGYLVHRLSAANWRTRDDVHAALAEELSFPGYYGHNLDALDECLGDVAEFEYGSDPATAGTVLVIDGGDLLVALDPAFAHALLDSFAGAARLGALLGHPMLCMVATTAELAPVGARPVPRERP